MHYRWVIGMSRFIRWLVVLGVLCGGAAQVYAADYNFHILAKSGDTIGGKTLTGVDSDISLNENGLVVFNGKFTGGEGIFTPTQLLAATGDTIGGKTLTYVSWPSANNNDSVAFYGQFAPSNGQGAFTPTDVIAATGSTIFGKTLTAFVGRPIVNNNGDVVFSGSFAGSEGIFSTQRGLLLQNGDTISGQTITVLGGSQALNDNGEVLSYLPDQLGVYTLGGLLILPGAPIADKHFLNLAASGYALNNNGTVVFQATFQEGGEGICTPTAILVATGDTINGKTITNIGNITPTREGLNNSDVLAFSAQYTDGSGGGSGVFTNNGVSEFIFGTGDVIDGKMVETAGNPSINDNGVLAFYTRFTDTTTAIVLAEPITAPAYSCVGFGPPMNNGAVTVKGNRALPLRGQLLDADSNPITDTGVTAPPVLQVLFDSGMGGDPIDVTDDALPAGQGTEGNQFVFDPVTQEWRYNLSSKNYTAEGTYILLMVSGDEAEYRIEPTCTATFVRE